MSATTLAPAPRRHSATLPSTPVPAGFGGALRSEWTKIRSVRSTFWTLIATIVLTVGASAAIAAGTASHDTLQQLQQQDLASATQNGIILGQLAMVVFGALAVTAEFTTGMIRTSFTSMPRRGVVLGAKALIVSTVALAVGLICSFSSFFIGAAIFGGKGAHVGLGDPHVLRAVVGGGLYLMVTALLAFGLGAVLRHTAGAITSAVGALFISTILVNFLPTAWHQAIGKWLPMNAGGQIITTQPSDHMFSAWTGFGVYAAYAAVVLVVGAALIRKRDA